MLSSNDFWQSLQNACHNSKIDEMLSRVYLKTAATKALSHEENGDAVSYGSSSVQGWRVYQEDAHIAIINFDSNSSLFAVFDGHNGPEVALYASKHLPQIILNNKQYKEGNIELALQEVFLTFDESLLLKEVNDELKNIRQTVIGDTISQTEKPGITSGSTALVILIKNDIIYVANVGDSRCVLSRNGKALSLSYDHKPEDCQERRRIERCGGRVVQGRINCGLNLSRAFGDHQYKRNKNLPLREQMVIALPQIKVKQIKFKKDEFIVIACDGIWNCMSNQKVVDFIRKRIKAKQNLSKICEDLNSHCLSPVRPIDGRTGGDNMTVIIVKFNYKTN
jgi:protein phosphatase 1G